MKTGEVRNALLGVLVVLGAFVPAVVGSAPPGAGPGKDHDALTAARFEISIDGTSIGVFSELTGISSGYEADLIQYSDRDGLVLPPTRTPPVIVLKRGKTLDLTIWQWHLAALGGQAGARKSCSLTMFNTKGDPVARYHLENAWPAKLEIGSLKAGASEVLYESVTIVAERIERVAR